MPLFFAENRLIFRIEGTENKPSCLMESLSGERIISYGIFWGLFPAAMRDKSVCDKS